MMRLRKQSQKKTPASKVGLTRLVKDPFHRLVAAAFGLVRLARKEPDQRIQVFGNLSSPGEVEAPIGLWTLRLKTRSGQASDVLLEIEVNQNPQYVMDTPTAVLSNSVQAKIGRPIIIGYNRDVYRTRTMGAMVVLLEADTAQTTDSQTKAPQSP